MPTSWARERGWSRRSVSRRRDRPPFIGWLSEAEQEDHEETKAYEGFRAPTRLRVPNEVMNLALYGDRRAANEKTFQKCFLVVGCSEPSMSPSIFTFFKPSCSSCSAVEAHSSYGGRPPTGSVLNTPGKSRK